MLTVGVAAHTRTTMAVVHDAAERKVARWGLPGAWHDGRGLAQFLVEAGATVDVVNARWTAAGLRPARRPGTSAGLDARASALKDAGPRRAAMESGGIYRPAPCPVKGILRPQETTDPHREG